MTASMNQKLNHVGYGCQFQTTIVSLSFGWLFFCAPSKMLRQYFRSLSHTAIARNASV